MRQFINKAVVGAVTLGLALSFVDVSQASSQGSNGTAGKSGLTNSVANGKPGGKNGGNGKSNGKSGGNGKSNGKGKYTGKWKNKGYKWKRSRFYNDYGTTLYSNDGDDALYYWCEPDQCYYPVSYCPYGQYSWPNS